MTETALPIDAVLPDLCATLRKRLNVVLVAPPGAGKTTRVPLALLSEDWAAQGRILMLEPRRVAARAAAERMAETLGEEVGQTVGYRIRDERAVSRNTRIEVVTEGILTRMMQSDPALEGIVAVIFDEFHERSIHADLGLALCLESQSALRDDLRLLAMSATLDAEGVARLMGDAPIIRSEGRIFPVETHWLDAPWRRANGPRDAFERAVAETVRRALVEETGDILVFLPGMGEIGRVQRALEDAPALLCPLHGGMPFAKQRAALRPDPEGRRRVVLSTAIAETSLTIEGVRVVVDGGQSRQPRFDAGAGMTRLVTVRVSRAAAEQRRGRAGRLGPGVCYRVWTKGEEGGFAPQDRAEILDADLAPLMLDLALWGVRDPAELGWIDLPPETAIEQARGLLSAIGALDSKAAITPHGRALASAPTHPRLAHMLERARAAGLGALGADLAALLEERDPVQGGGVDLTWRIEALRDTGKFLGERNAQVDRAALARIRDGSKRLRRKGEGASAGTLADIGRLVASAYPDRVARRRPGEAARYLLSGGRGAVFRDAADRLADAPFLAIAHLDGNPREASIRLAAPLTRADIETAFADDIEDVESCVWDAQTDAVIAQRQRRFGAVVLDERKWSDVPKQAIAEAALQGFQRYGIDVLPWEGEAGRLRARVIWLSAQAVSPAPMPDWSDVALMEGASEWLLPHLGGVRSKPGFASLPLKNILMNMLDWQAREALDRLAPEALETPAGSRARIDYTSDPPALEVRIQEMFGLTRHPSIAGGRVPLLIRFLSPARRPVQVTGDLPGFWANSYQDVRKDLRGRYPRHPWPEDPLAAPPTSRVKPRKR